MGSKWEYVGFRNMSLLQISIWAKGLNNKGFFPPLRFHIGKYVGVGDIKGNHGIFDRKAMSDALLTLQQDIDSNAAFPSQMHQKALSVYKRLRHESAKLDFLGQKSGKELVATYSNFINVMTSGPIILMPMYAVDGCLAENFSLMKFLRKKRCSPSEIAMLSTTTYKTVAFMEREEFLKMAIGLAKGKNISEKLKKYMNRYGWVRSEYRSGIVGEKGYLKELRKIKNPKKELELLKTKRKTALESKKRLIMKLQPDSKVLRIIDALDEFVWETDYSKGIFSEAFLHFRKLLEEISRRKNIPIEDLHYYTIDELTILIKQGNKVNIAARKKGYAMLLNESRINVYAGIQRTEFIRKSGINALFEKPKKTRVLTGLCGSPGRAEGKAVLIRSIADMAKLKKGDIVITHMTTMEFTPIFSKAAAIVTDEGSLGCHAAIVSREFRIPCVVGTKSATKLIKQGSRILVDADNGMVEILK